MYRQDNSFKSSNNRGSKSIEAQKDFGIYRALITKIYYSDDEKNTTNKELATEVLYEVQIVGGPRDGQIFSDARLVSNLGGISNYTEITLKPTTTPTGADFANSALTFDDVNSLNGDLVYIQFVNGNVYSPLIIGGSKHTLNTNKGVTVEEKSQYKTQFNGISTKIDKDGIFSWIKSKGQFQTLLPNPSGANPTFFQEQYVPFPGFEEAIKVTLDNNFLFTFKMNTAPDQGISVVLDGMADTFNITTLVGSSFLIDGTADKFSATTKAGMAVIIDGINDKFNLTSLIGAAIELDGLSDKLSFLTTAGSSLIVSGTDGVTAQDAAGDKILLSNGAVELTNASGAFLKMDATGFLKFGNSSGDVLKDILQELIKTLTTEAPSGFGAPLTNVATYVQLLTKMMLITGG